jgi:hypothetical protein
MCLTKNVAIVKNKGIWATELQIINLIETLTLVVEYYIERGKEVRIN